MPRLVEARSGYIYIERSSNLPIMAVRKLTIFESLWSLWELIRQHWLASTATGATQVGALYVIWEHIQAAAADVGWGVYVLLAALIFFSLVGVAYTLEAFRGSKGKLGGAAFSASFDGRGDVTPHKEHNIRDIFFLNAQVQRNAGNFDCIVVFNEEIGECRHVVTCSNKARNYKMEMKHVSAVCRHVRFSGVRFPCKIDVLLEPTI